MFSNIKKPVMQFVCLTFAFFSIFNASAFAQMTTDEGRAIVQPFYDFLSGKVDADEAFANMSPDWRSFSDSETSKGIEETAAAVSGMITNNVTDLNWEIKDLLVADDHVVVRGEATGTPTKEFFGVPVSGNSFKIMSIDIHKIVDGKVKASWHIENWSQALRQLKQ